MKMSTMFWILCGLAALMAVWFVVVGLLIATGGFGE
jgi:hypothetical protein